MKHHPDRDAVGDIADYRADKRHGRILPERRRSQKRQVHHEAGLLVSCTGKSYFYFRDSAAGKPARKRSRFRINIQPLTSAVACRAQFFELDSG